MQIVIDIQEEVYQKIQERKVNQYDIDDICNAMYNGTPLPKGHGRLIDSEEMKFCIVHIPSPCLAVMVDNNYLYKIADFYSEKTADLFMEMLEELFEGSEE